MYWNDLDLKNDELHSIKDCVDYGIFILDTKNISKEKFQKSGILPLSDLYQ